MGVVRRYIDIFIIIITFPYSTCISSFLATEYIPTSLFICFFVLVCYFCAIYQKLLKEHSRSFKNRVLRESRDFHSTCKDRVMFHVR